MRNGWTRRDALVYDLRRNIGRPGASRGSLRIFPRAFCTGSMEVVGPMERDGLAPRTSSSPSLPVPAGQKQLPRRFSQPFPTSGPMAQLSPVAPASSEAPGVSVYMMLPLDTVNAEGFFRYAGTGWFSQALQMLVSSGVHGVAMDFWWGAVEKSPGQYNWAGYKQVLEVIKQTGLRVQAVMSFHACGGNVGDTAQVPLPEWVLQCGEADPDLFFADRPRNGGRGNRNREYISIWADDAPGVLRGRSPLQCYEDFMVSFRDNFSQDLGTVIDEVVVGTGPCGELRLPSYVEANGWRFPGAGEFQCYDRRALASLAQAAREAGHPEWGYTGPHDAGEYNSTPEHTGFFSHNGSWNTPYGRFFLDWYSSCLLRHGERLLSLANQVFAGRLGGSHLAAGQLQPTHGSALYHSASQLLHSSQFASRMSLNRITEDFVLGASSGGSYEMGPAARGSGMRTGLPDALAMPPPGSVPVSQQRRQGEGSVSCCGMAGAGGLLGSSSSLVAFFGGSSGSMAAGAGMGMGAGGMLSSHPPGSAFSGSTPLLSPRLLAGLSAGGSLHAAATALGSRTTSQQLPPPQLPRQASYQQINQPSQPAQQQQGQLPQLPQQQLVQMAQLQQPVALQEPVTHSALHSSPGPGPPLASRSNSAGGVGTAAAVLLRNAGLAASCGVAALLQAPGGEPVAVPVSNGSICSSTSGSGNTNVALTCEVNLMDVEPSDVSHTSTVGTEVLQAVAMSCPPTTNATPNPLCSSRFRSSASILTDGEPTFGSGQSTAFAAAAAAAAGVLIASGGTARMDLCNSLSSLSTEFAMSAGGHQPAGGNLLYLDVAASLVADGDDESELGNSCCTGGVPEEGDDLFSMAAAARACLSDCPLPSSGIMHTGGMGLGSIGMGLAGRGSGVFFGDEARRRSADLSGASGGSSGAMGSSAAAAAPAFVASSLLSPTASAVAMNATGCAAAERASTGLHLALKMAGIHWWYRSRSHAAELTAGYYNTADHDGYAPIVDMCARHRANLILTCVEMCDSQHPAHAQCGPEGLLRQLRQLAARADVSLSGENALPIFSPGGVNSEALERIVQNMRGWPQAASNGGNGGNGNGLGPGQQATGVVTLAQASGGPLAWASVHGCWPSHVHPAATHSAPQLAGYHGTQQQQQGLGHGMVAGGGNIVAFGQGLASGAWGRGAANGNGNVGGAVTPGPLLSSLSEQQQQAQQPSTSQGGAAGGQGGQQQQQLSCADRAPSGLLVQVPGVPGFRQGGGFSACPSPAGVVGGVDGSLPPLRAFTFLRLVPEMLLPGYQGMWLRFMNRLQQGA